MKENETLTQDERCYDDFFTNQCLIEAMKINDSRMKICLGFSNIFEIEFLFFISLNLFFHFRSLHNRMNDKIYFLVFSFSFSL